MAYNLRKTKITCTLGPATCGKLWTLESLKDPSRASEVEQAYQTIEGITNAGFSVCRLNFSHGTQDEQMVRVEMVRNVSKKLNTPISLLLDTKGPEIRLCEIIEGQGLVKAGDVVVIQSTKKIKGTGKEFSVTDSTGKYNMANDIGVGSLILIDDGKLWLKATAVDKASGKITSVAENSHTIKTNKRINLPGAAYTMPFISKKDQEDIKLACKEKFDYIAASFVNNVENIKEIRKIIGKADIKIIAKIESTDGIKNLDKIIAESDGIMVARGDLGIEIPYYDVPYYEEYMIERCRKLGKPVIVATQMLDSMERNLLCTRAESTDVYFASKAGADATMTSGETAQGLFPVQTVQTMCNLNQAAERLFDYDAAIANLSKLYTGVARTTALAIAKKTKPEAQRTLKAKFPFELVVLYDDNDQVIKAVSAVRPAAHVIFVTDNRSTYTKYGAYYGVTGWLVKDKNEAAKNLKATTAAIVKQYGRGSKKAISFLKGKFI
ncbi:MAG: pyruvate kinase [Mycoplasmataceae bacterium]|nr:pyruvate kinase [Mycoplasmataceae bacterium]